MTPQLEVKSPFVPFHMVYYGLNAILCLWLFNEESMIMSCFNGFPPQVFRYVSMDGWSVWMWDTQHGRVFFALSYSLYITHILAPRGTPTGRFWV